MSARCEFVRAHIVSVDEFVDRVKADRGIASVRFVTSAEMLMEHELDAADVVGVLRELPFATYVEIVKDMPGLFAEKEEDDEG